jgi:hypothetical protein
MKRETRGRPSKLSDAVTRCTCAYLRKGVDQKTACNLARVPYSTYNEWKTRGQNGARAKARADIEAAQKNLKELETTR